MRTIRWGILGPGNIAHRFAGGLSVLPDAELTAVGSRSVEKAAEFAKEFDIPNKHGSYIDLANDPDVDVVYVATLHPFHVVCLVLINAISSRSFNEAKANEREHSILCLKAGKAVLCEKPLAINTQEVEEIIRCARESKKFLMEAMWTRFIPVMARVREWLVEGTIGEVRMLTVDFGFRSGWNPEDRLLNPNMAGGALLDVGVYTVAMASMVFGGQPSRIASIAHIGETGVDEQSSMRTGFLRKPVAGIRCRAISYSIMRHKD